MLHKGPPRQRVLLAQSEVRHAEPSRRRQL